MILKVYSIYDDAVKTFLTPHFAKTPGEAERNFKHAVNDPKNGHLHNSPEFFTLFELGEYDDQTGQITALASPHCVVKAIQCKNPDNVRSMA